MANQVIEDIKFKIRSGNPITRLIIINIVVFLFISILRILSFLSGESGIMNTIEGFVMRNLSLPLSFEGVIHKPWTLITYMFTQFKVRHILWNLITLYWFASILSDFTNARKIIPLYLLGGVAGGIITILLFQFIPVFQTSLGAPLIGASAGVTAIIVAAATLIPNYKMNLMFVGAIKLIYVAMFVIFIDVLDLSSYDNMGGNLAHLGGALMGFIFITQYKKGRDMAKPFNSFFDRLKSIFSSAPKAKMKVVSKKKVSDEEYNAQKRATQQQIDAILDKISKSGYESLTKNEKEILFKASNK